MYWHHCQHALELHLLHHYILDNNWWFFRFARSNSIFLGLWFGYKKPDFLTFLQPLSKEFQDIYSQGIFKLYLSLAIYKLDIHVLCVIILKIFVHDIELSLLYMQLHNLLLQVWKLPTVKEKTSHWEEFYCVQQWMHQLSAWCKILFSTMALVGVLIVWIRELLSRQVLKATHMPIHLTEKIHLRVMELSKLMKTLCSMPMILINQD